MIELSPDQRRAQERILDFFEKGEDLLTFGGYAGTGKTTVVAESVRAMGPGRPPIAFCAFSAKAGAVLRSKLQAQNILRETDYCGTIHGLIYDLFAAKLKIAKKSDHRLVVESGKRTPIKEKMEMDLAFQAKGGTERKYAYVILDEASMVGDEVFQDLAALGLPILAVGDHGQLPPVMASGGLMIDPMIRLEKIHRQAEGDPIIEVSRIAREVGRILCGEFGPGVKKIRATNDLSWTKNLNKEWMMICGRNTTRIFYNDHLRRLYGFKDHDAMVGERVVCLKNNHEKKVFNGELGIIRSLKSFADHWYLAGIEMESGEFFLGEILKHQFGSQSTCFSYPPANLSESEVGGLFNWGWCVTCHKSQGSEWDSVVVFEERTQPSHDDWKRWLYTAITRSKKQLLIVGS